MGCYFLGSQYRGHPTSFRFTAANCWEEQFPCYTGCVSFWHSMGQLLIQFVIFTERPSSCVISLQHLGFEKFVPQRMWMLLSPLKFPSGRRIRKLKKCHQATANVEAIIFKKVHGHRPEKVLFSPVACSYQLRATQACSSVHHAVMNVSSRAVVAQGKMNV